MTWQTSSRPWTLQDRTPPTPRTQAAHKSTMTDRQDQSATRYRSGQSRRAQGPNHRDVNSVATGTRQHEQRHRRQHQIITGRSSEPTPRQPSATNSAPSVVPTVGLNPRLAASTQVNLYRATDSSSVGGSGSGGHAGAGQSGPEAAYQIAGIGSLVVAVRRQQIN